MELGLLRGIRWFLQELWRGWCFFLEIPEGRGDVFKKLKRVVKWFG